MGVPTRIRLYQLGILVPAALLMTLFLHWFITQPLPIKPGKYELTIWAELLFSVEPPSSIYDYFLRYFLGMIATTGLGSCALAVMLAIRVPEQISARRLAWTLVCGSGAAAYVFFVTTHAQYREMLGWKADAPSRLLFDFAAYSAGLLSPLCLVRFFMSYPRSLTPEEVEADQLRRIQKARESIRSKTGWRRWVYWVVPTSWRTRMATNAPEKKWLRFSSDAEVARQESRQIVVWKSRKPVIILIVWAFLSATLDCWSARQVPDPGQHWITALVNGAMFVSMLSMVTFGMAGSAIVMCLQVVYSSATPQDRQKIDWIRSTFIVGGILAGSIYLGGMPIMAFVMTELSRREIFIPAGLLLLGPFIISIQFLVLAFVVSLALSIFYRGAIDPRLAARKVTVFGVLGLLVALLFLLIERTVAMKIVAFFNLAPDAGALIAGASVAATVAPIKNHAEKVITDFVGRFLPLDSMIEGNKHVVVVALSDLSGYTELSSRDEKQALLAAALLQRLANKLVSLHGGRVVKSMGDAVMFCFDNAATAVKVLASLHRDFAPASEQLGITPLLVHSGAHQGEVTVSHDGDLYGQTVNIAARIQGSAEPGQILVSDAIALEVGEIACRNLGSRQFKNLPQAISCHELLQLLPSHAAG